MLQKLLPELADRGFIIGESVGVMQAKQHIPAFTKDKTQSTATEVEETRSIDMHVEWVIGCIKHFYNLKYPSHFVYTRKG